MTSYIIPQKDAMTSGIIAQKDTMTSGMIVSPRLQNADAPALIIAVVFMNNGRLVAAVSE